MATLLDNTLLDRLQRQASESERLRVGFDLRTSPSDGSQRMLNVLMPGTKVPVHRHTKSVETMIVIRGSVTEVFFDEKGNETSRFLLKQNSKNFGIQIPMGQWHTVIVTEPCTIIEIKDGKYTPLDESDILKL